MRSLPSRVFGVLSVAGYSDAVQQLRSRDYHDLSPPDLTLIDQDLTRGGHQDPGTPKKVVPGWVPLDLRPRYQEVFDRVDAYFNVVESHLPDVEYDRIPACTEKKNSPNESRPYINSVVHIKQRTWREVCGNLSSDTTRGSELRLILDKIVPGLDDSIDVHIPFGLHDGVQNVREDNQNQPVVGIMYHSAFSPITVPFAMGCTRTLNRAKAYMNSPVVGWDDFVQAHYTCNQTAASINKAAFRGRAHYKRSKYGTCCGSTCQAACDYLDNGRLFAHQMGQDYPDMLDAVVSNVEDFDVGLKPSNDSFLAYPQQLCQYRAVLNIGSNADWAERLRTSFFGNAVVMSPRRAPQEFFSSFLQPKKNYWPIKPDLSDMMQQIYDVTHLQDTSSLIRAQRVFAEEYLTEEFMYLWNQVVIEQFFVRAKEYKQQGRAAYMDMNRRASRTKYSEWLLGLEGCSDITSKCTHRATIDPAELLHKPKSGKAGTR